VDIPQIDIAELEQRLADGAALLDVRTPEEYQNGHVAGAVLIPLPELPDRLADVPGGEPLLVICQAGGRSQRACELLATEGRTVANVTGGTGAWIESGRPVVTGSGPG
jgi:rhodanese-related sulfurtransferase